MSSRAGAFGAAICLLALAGPSSAETTVPVVPKTFAGRPAPNVRSCAPDLKLLIQSGSTRSSSFRALLDRLERSDVVVYVRCEFPITLSSQFNGKLSFLSQVGSLRYLMVELRCPNSPDKQLAWLAHELRHAVEIADAPHVNDEATMLDHYSRVGFPAFGDSHARRAFETMEAKEAGDAVSREIR